LIKHRRKIYQESTKQLTPEELKNLKPIGVTIPFNKKNGIFNQSYTDREQVISNLKNLLLTRKGERIMQPEFGTDLQYYLFEQITDEFEFQEKLIGEIRSSLSFWMPYVSIQDLNVDTNPVSDSRIVEPNHAVVITLKLYISGVNIYLPVRLLISETGTLSLETEV
jgi:phage baseplate assembly protein W